MSNTTSQTSLLSSTIITFNPSDMAFASFLRRNTFIHINARRMPESKGNLLHLSQIQYLFYTINTLASHHFPVKKLHLHRLKKVPAMLLSPKTITKNYNIISACFIPRSRQRVLFFRMGSFDNWQPGPQCFNFYGSIAHK